MRPDSLTLAELTDLLGGTLLNSTDPGPVIRSVVSSGDHQQPESIFVAYKGVTADGHEYIDQAFANGAVAAVVTDASRLGERPGILAQDGQRALSRLCAAFAGDPSKELLTVGITGTNGKTTIHWLLYHALGRLGLPAIRIGSLGIAAEGRVERSGKVTTRNAGRIVLTTPAACEIHESLCLALEQGVKACVLETSSHALDQRRVSDVWYDAAVFTNLTTDHLDYHHDMEAYFQTKVGLFRQLAAQRAETGGERGGAVVNTDCPYGRRLIDIVREMGLPAVTFGEDRSAKVRIVAFDQGFEHSTLTLELEGERYEIGTNLIGDYNASNMAAAFAALISLELDPQEAAAALSEIPSVPGRLESVGTPDIAVLVDYAHTGDGLRNLLSALKGFVENELWVVFGCGGGKDPRKREGMGRAAKELADRIVLTSDNPKNEDPEKIIHDILASGCEPELIELDRGRAIEQTLRKAQKGDVVVLVGKGHEDYQIIGNQTFYFSDREEALKWREQGLLDR